MRRTVCSACSGDLKIDESGLRGECPWCHRVYDVEIPLTDKSFVKLQNAMEYQRTNRYADAVRAFVEVTEEDPDNSEAWWGAFLSEYGIEFGYNRNGNRVPTCHRTNAQSVYENKYYKNAIKTVPKDSKKIYEELGENIEYVRKEILEKVEDGNPYDVFICFKATEVNDATRRTADYDFGNTVYDFLTKKGYNVFFSAQTLTRVKEQDYEPYIYRALSTARVMLLLCSDEDEIESAWVKNEWSRYLDMHNGKGLVPICGNRFEPFSPARLPSELQKLNAIEYDEKVLEKIEQKVSAYFEDRIKAQEEERRKREEEKRAEAERRRQAELEELKAAVTANMSNQSQMDELRAEIAASRSKGGNEGGPSVANLLKRAYGYLEDGDKTNAKQYFERVLDIDVECVKAYVGELLLETGNKKEADLAKTLSDWEKSNNYKKAYRYADKNYQKILEDYVAEKNRGVAYRAAFNAYESNEKNLAKQFSTEAQRAKKLEQAQQEFIALGSYKNSPDMAENCEHAIIRKAQNILRQVEKDERDLATGIDTFCKDVLNNFVEKLADYEPVQPTLEEIKAAVYGTAKTLYEKDNHADLLKARDIYTMLAKEGYKDSAKKADDCAEVIYQGALAKEEEAKAKEEINAFLAQDLALKAAEIYELVPYYKDTIERAKAMRDYEREIEYNRAKDTEEQAREAVTRNPRFAQQMAVKAAKYYEAMGGYKDAEARARAMLVFERKSKQDESDKAERAANARKEAIKRAMEKSTMIKTLVPFIIAAVLLAVGVVFSMMPHIFLTFIDWFALCLIVIGLIAIITCVGAVCNSSYSTGASSAFLKLNVLACIAAFVMFIVGFSTAADKTYKLSTVRDFNLIEYMPNADEAKFVLEKDIDFEGADYDGYAKIKVFKGTFDGNGHTIKNMKVEATMKNSLSSKPMGLFRTNEGTITNITFENCGVKSSDKVWDEVEGAAFLCGKNTGTIEKITFNNCYVTGAYESSRVGMLCAINAEQGSIKNIKVVGANISINNDIQVSYYEHYSANVAIITAENMATIENVVIEDSTLTNMDETSIGFVCGTNGNGGKVSKITVLRSVMDVTAPYAGFIGNNSSTVAVKDVRMEECRFTLKTESDTDSCSWGLLTGVNSGAGFENCKLVNNQFNTQVSTKSNDRYVGLFIGRSNKGANTFGARKIEITDVAKTLEEWKNVLSAYAYTDVLAKNALESYQHNPTFAWLTGADGYATPFVPFQ